MNLRSLSLLFLLALGAPAARAQVNIHIDLGLPPVPRLVFIAPGVQVVEAFPEEVFFHSGWYWCRRSDGWYRAHHPRARFDWVAARRVPPALVRIPPGHYRNWRRDDGPRDASRDRRLDRREAHHWQERERKERRHEERREHGHHH
ncbi:MAG: hypothetical protein LWX11_10595 [Firmicutes bacterium]|nr:hypothetical protein [Bacillota bacterium]